MTVTMERPAPAPSVATAALARAETRRMWHSPYYWLGLILAVALSLAWSWTRMPTWETFHENIGMGSLVLAANLLLATHLAAGRDHRAGAEESLGTTPTGSGRRSLALLVSVPIAAATGVLVYLITLLSLLPTWPVGRFEPWAAAVVVVIPAIGAAIGVAVGRLLPAVAVGPLTAVALAAVLFVLLASGQSPGGVADALFPVPLVVLDFGVPYPFGWHLLYLSGLLVLAVATVCRPAAPKTSAVVAVAAVVFAGFAVQREAAGVPDVIDESVIAAAVATDKLDCRTVESVRYCALPGYGEWTEHWRAAVEPVAELLPPAATRPSVRQIANMFDGEPETPGLPEVIVGDTWGRIGGWAADSRERLIRDYGATATGLLHRENLGTGGSCDGAGQHRTVVAIWLMEQAAPGEHLTVPRIRYGQAETQAAATLLAKPRDEVSRYLAEHWAEVLDPAATGLAGLGVTITPPPIPTEPPATPGDQWGEDRGVCR